VQAIVLNITDKQAPYAQQVVADMERCGLRVEADLRNEKVGFKIREHSLARIPYLLVVGDREMETGTLAVRKRSGEDLGAITREAFSDLLYQEAVTRVV